MKGKNKGPKATQSVRINQDVAKDAKVFATRKGGSIKAILEYGAKWVMAEGREQYIESVKTGK